MSRGDAELAALIAAVDGDDDLQLQIGEALGRFRRRRQQEITDREAAELLPKLKATGVAERKKCHLSTVYRRAQRSRQKTLARIPPLANDR